MCCLVWMLFKRKFVYVMSGVGVVYTIICRCAVGYGYCLNENLYMCCLMWMLFKREIVCVVWCECCLYENL